MLFRIRAAISTIVGLALLGCCLATFILQPADETQNFALPSCLLALSILWLFIGVCASRTDIPLLLGEPEAGVALLLFGGAMLIVELTYRLLCAPSFGGSIANFDFGLKCPVHNETEHKATSCERNAAFTPSFNSFGHCIQGALSLLLLPAVEHAAARRGATSLILVRSLSCFVAGYPICNGKLELDPSYHFQNSRAPRTLVASVFSPSRPMHLLRR